MVKKSHQVTPNVARLIAAMAEALEPLKVPYAVGGAVAMSAHGVRRHTDDVDVFALDEDRPKVLRALRAAGLRIVEVMSPFHYAAYLPDVDDPEVRIDVLFPAGEPELSAVEYPARAEIGGVEFNVFALELLVATKFYSDRVKDELDIARMYESGVFEPATVRALIASFDPDGAKEFDALMKRLAQPRTKRARPTRKGK